MPAPLVAAAAVKAVPFLVKAAPAIAQTAAGLFQTVFSGRKNAEKSMESQLNNSPAYTPNKNISDYYQESLNRYNESPYQSALYQTATRNAQRATSQGISALQDRRSALVGVSRLAATQNDATQDAGVRAEQLRNQRFGQLGQATNMKAGEDRRAFDINVLTPYQRRLQFAQMKASAANARNDAGTQNLFGGLSNLSMMATSGMLGKNETKSADETYQFPTISTPLNTPSSSSGMVTPTTMPTFKPLEMNNNTGVGTFNTNPLRSLRKNISVMPKKFGI